MNERMNHIISRETDARNKCIQVMQQANKNLVKNKQTRTSKKR